jgi:hypothetical protein
MVRIGVNDFSGLSLDFSMQNSIGQPHYSANGSECQTAHRAHLRHSIRLVLPLGHFLL